jgi:probable phosphoglycerate mutase
MIYLLRHGKIKGASTKRFIGQTDVGLSQAGLELAALWQKRLSSINMDHVFASSLSRCVDMATIVSGYAQNTISLMDELREINLGTWDGKAVAEIRDNFPEEWEKRGKDFTGYRPPLGESFFDLFQRVVPVFHEISKQYPGNILVVAHAGVNRMILCNLLNKNIADLFSIPQDYGCLNIIDNGHDIPRVQGINLMPDGCEA